MSLTAYVINIDTRNDRWKDIQQRFQSIKSIDLQQFQVKKHPLKGATGCRESHQKLVRMAKENKMDYILVMEDDCLPIKNFDDKFPQVLEWLTNNMDKWTLFNGGPGLHEIKAKPTISIIDKVIPLIEINGGYMTQFIIYNKSIYDKILECPETDPIDVFINDQIKQLTTVPILSSQIEGHSDISNRQLNYSSMFKRTDEYFEAEVKRIMNK